jgi:tetratricopeptide (TPR) repeat protein
VLLGVFSSATLWAQAALPSPPNVPASSRCTTPASKADKQPGSAACATTPPAPNPVAERFPYPGEAKVPSVLATAPAQRSGDSAKDFPYPGDPSSSSSGSSNSNSSSSSSSVSGDVPPADAPPPQAGRRILPKVRHLQSDEDRESEDLDIAKYYRQSGNLQAAYLRAKDAVKMQPGDSEAHYALADAAQHLGKRDEAVSEYTVYLKLDPDGDRVKSVRKTLASLK